MNAEEEAAIAAHVEQCIACRTGLESIAAGDRSAELLVQKFREERVELGPAMREMLDSLGTRQPEIEPRKIAARPMRNCRFSIRPTAPIASADWAVIAC